MELKRQKLLRHYLLPGATTNFVVPVGVTSISVYAVGGGGGSGYQDSEGPGGGGGYSLD